MKVLVTGGAGFIGSHLVDALILRGDSVIVVDSMIDGYESNLEMAFTSGRCQILKIDIRNQTSMMNDLEKVDIIYHWAADPDVRNSVPNPMNSFDHNMKGTMNVLEYARKYDIKKMVFASSGGTVYGEVNKFPISEDCLLNPISPYGASKAAAEMYLSAYATPII
jgi:UDP-glucose 4-epimerase